MATALAGVTFKVACAWHAICSLCLACYLWLAFGKLFVACIWRVICGVHLASYLWLAIGELFVAFGGDLWSVF